MISLVKVKAGLSLVLPEDFGGFSYSHSDLSIFLSFLCHPDLVTRHIFAVLKNIPLSQVAHMANTVFTFNSVGNCYDFDEVIKLIPENLH